MIVSVALKGDKELIARLERMPGAVQQALELKVTVLALKLENLVKTGKLNGQVLNRISGRLARSINKKVVVSATGVVGRVFSAGDVKYAGIHEFGGNIKHPGGTAYLPIGAGKVAFLSNLWAAGYKGSELPRTKPHDIKMPERSFLRSSLRDMSVEISTGLKQAAVHAAVQGIR